MSRLLVVFAVFSHPVSIFILQLALIIAASRFFGFLFRKMGQPAVMGEIIAGVALGPSLIGGAFPAFTQFVFPTASLGNLRILSELGLILFMFVVGMELDLRLVKKKIRSAMVIGVVSILIPYALGILLSLYLHADYAPAGIPFLHFALFTGIAMSITAFPVLARILRERGISDTRLGSTTIMSAAINDVAGWCILAVVIAITRAGSLDSALFTLAAAVLYTCLMFFAIRPLLKKLPLVTSGGEAQRYSVAIILVTLLLSSYCAEVIGIHTLFGAFMAGVIMPHDRNFRKLIVNKIEDVALVMLLPVFFIFTGLRTEIELLNTPASWAACLLITALAIVGKFGGAAIAARASGESAHHSLAIGALMNTRGLMELIVLNIGYDLGILSPQVFAMMVVMALVTTLMTSPVLNLLDRRYGKTSA